MITNPLMDLLVISGIHILIHSPSARFPMVGICLRISKLGVKAPRAPIGVPVHFQVTLRDPEARQLLAGLEADWHVCQYVVFTLELRLEVGVQMQVGVVEGLDNAVVLTLRRPRRRASDCLNGLFPPSLAGHPARD